MDTKSRQAAAFPPTSIPRLTTHVRVLLLCRIMFSQLSQAPSQAETPARSAKYQSVPHSGKTDLNVDSKPIISPSISRLSNTTRSSIDATTIQQLTKELGQLKQQWNVGISRENEIIADLRRLQSAFIPEPSRLVTSNEESSKLLSDHSNERMSTLILANDCSFESTARTSRGGTENRATATSGSRKNPGGRQKRVCLSIYCTSAIRCLQSHVKVDIKSQCVALRKLMIHLCT